MSLHEVEGTVTALGQSRFDNDMTLYAYIELTGTTGARTLIEKVAVCNDVGAVLALGLSGQFFVDRIYRSGNLRCQLWGVRNDRIAVLDSKDLRARIGIIKVLTGIPAILILGLGLIIIADGICLLANGGDRRRLFLKGAPPFGLHTQVARI